MPWSNQGGGWQGGGGSGGGGGRGPWGQGPSGPKPPDLEELLRKGQDRFKGFLPGGAWGGRGILLVILIIVAVWMFSGFYRVQPDEQGVVLTFGEWTETTQSGLNYHLPYPIQDHETPKVTRVNRIEVGYASPEFRRTAGRRDVPEESLMLTGDENIIDIDFTVFWVINDAGKYLFNIDRPEETVKAMAESAMREVIGKNKLQSALTEGREPIEQATKELMQSVLDEYESGVLITQVKMQKVDPPGAVIDAFRDVQAAKADKERQINEAEAYSNDVIPRARGDAQKIIEDAQAYKQRVIAEAEGEAQRFLAVHKQYELAKDVTSRRLYLETMEQVLRGSEKVIIDSGAGGSGVVPYLPLPELQKKSGANR
jgi:membrane protease subunit HflK